MTPGETLYVTDPRSWREWLRKNHKKKNEIWLVYYRKETGKPRISYDEAVEEALCFGWIDSTVRSLDDERFAQRFSPRKKTSRLSEMNRQRIRTLIDQKRMTKAGLQAVAHVFDPEAGDGGPIEIAPDILQALKENEQAWANFQAFPEHYKRIRIAYIESQRRHGEEQFRRALDHFIRMTEKNKRFGLVK